jgi:hypothetical protein
VPDSLLERTFDVFRRFLRFVVSFASASGSFDIDRASLRESARSRAAHCSAALHIGFKTWRYREARRARSDGSRTAVEFARHNRR